MPDEGGDAMTLRAVVRGLVDLSSFIGIIVTVMLALALLAPPVLALVSVWGRWWGLPW